MSTDLHGHASIVHAADSSRDGLLDKREVLRMFGGTRPLNASTLYRQIKAGKLPRPIHVGGSSRWLLSECQAVLRRMMEARQ
jgi:predicted DNA-binding transcriptional regulator AlpA